MSVSAWDLKAFVFSAMRTLWMSAQDIETK
jgi:hypothetical protein